MNFYRKKGQKYGNKKVSHAGYSFASKMEAGLFDYLKLRESNGEIKDIKCQVSVRLTDAEILYKPDFSFFNIAKKIVEYAEAKGYETPSWRIKRRLWIHYGPGNLYIYKGYFPRIILAEVLERK